MNSPLFEVYMIKKHILSNGLVVIHEPVDHVQSIALNLWIKVGSIKENKKNNGVSHFIEHMMFKGNDKYSAKDIAYIMDGYGAEINAYTTKELTCIYTKVISKYFEQALDVLNEMVFHPNFDHEDIKNEIDVIMDEIAMYEDSPEDLVYENMTQFMFTGSSLERPILGTNETISNMNHEVLKDFYKTYYQPENMVLSIVGKYEEDQLISTLEKVFGRHESAYLPVSTETSMEHYDYIYKYKDIEQVHVCVGFKGVPYGTKDHFPFILLNAILGGNTSSKLFQTIREEHGLTYSIYSHTAFDHDHGLLNVSFSINPKNLTKALKLIAEVLVDFANGKISIEAFEHGKSQAINSYTIGLEQTEDLVESYGKAHIFSNEIYSVEKTMRDIESIEYNDVCRLAKEIFKDDQFAMSMVGSIDESIGRESYIKFKEIIGGNYED